MRQKSYKAMFHAQYNQLVVRQQRTLMKNIWLRCLALGLVLIIGIGFEVILRSPFDTVYTPLTGIVVFAGLMAGLYYVTRWIREIREDPPQPMKRT